VPVSCEFVIGVCNKNLLSPKEIFRGIAFNYNNELKKILHFADDTQVGAFSY
jgi:hypothetical protein